MPRDRLEQIVDALVTVPARLRGAPEAAAHHRQPAQGARRRPRRLVARRGARVRLAAPRRHAGAARGPGHAAGHVQPAPRGARRPRRPKHEYTPLAHLGDDAAPFMVYDSVLSEFAALGFEYGYSVADRDALVCWEAQFGDFANGAQTIIDQFIVAAEDKWGQQQRARAAAPARLRRPGPRALVGPARTLPRAVRRGQHARRLPDHRRAVLPRAAPPGARSRPQADDRDDAEALPAHAGDVLAARRRSSRARSSSCSPTPPRPIPRSVTRLVFCTRQVRARAARPPRRGAGAGRDRARSSSSTRGPSARSPTELASVPERRGHLGPGRAGQHGRPLLRPPPHRGDVPAAAPVGVVARPASPSPASGSSTVHDAQQQALLEEAVPTP